LTDKTPDARFLRDPEDFVIARESAYEIKHPMWRVVTVYIRRDGTVPRDVPYENIS